MSKTDSLHYQLCCEGAKWLRLQKRNYEACKKRKCFTFGTCPSAACNKFKYVAVELVSWGENTDVWGLGNYNNSAVIEVKVSHADFLADATAKELEDQPIEERIARFVAEFPDPDKAVPFKSLYTWHHVLTGSCTMGRDEFTRSHSLDTAKDYTPRYFIEITAHAYGGEAIRQLAERYGIKID